MTAAIPIELLPSTLTVRVPADGDWGGGYAEPVEIAHVRFDSASAFSPLAYRFAEGSKGLVFVDAANSSGAFDIPTGSLASIDGGPEMNVVACTRLETVRGSVHHWEVEVA